MKTRRTKRAEALYNMGFLKAEARDLSVHTWQTLKTTPYIARLIVERQNAVQGAQNMRWTRKRYDDWVRQTSYADKKKRHKIGAAWRPDIWSIIREREDKFKDTDTRYESPWKQETKNLRKWKEGFIA